MHLADFFTKRPAVTIAIMVAIAALGIGALVGMEADGEPDFALPAVAVTLQSPGSTAAGVERDVLAPIEARLASVPDVERVESVARDGSGRIVVRFASSTPTTRAERDVRVAVSSVHRGAAAGAPEAGVTPGDPDADPAMVLAVRSNSYDVARLRELVDAEIVPTLRAVPGVANLTVWGAHLVPTRATGGSLASGADTAAIAISLIKSPAFSASTLSRAIRSKLDALEPTFPPGARLDVVHDAGQHAETSLARLDLTIGSGAVLALLVVLAFLRSWRSAAIISIAVLVSLLATVAAVRVVGLPLNVPVVLSLAIAGAVLIDQAVIVRESIVRHRELGMSRRAAGTAAVIETGRTMLVSSAGLAAIVFIVARAGGIAGQWLEALGLPLSIAIVASPLVVLCTVPTLSSLLRDRSWREHPREPRRRLDRFDAWFERMADRYHDLLARALDHDWITAGIAAGSVALVAIVYLFAGRASVAPNAHAMPATIDVDATSLRGRLAADPATPGLHSSGITRRRDVELEVRGADASTLNGLARHIADEITNVPGVVDVSLSTTARRAVVSDNEMPLLGDATRDVDDTTNTEAASPSQIERADGQRIVRVFAGVDGRSVDDATTDVQVRLATIPVPPGYDVAVQGALARRAELVERVGTAAAIGVGMLYLLLAVHLGSILAPFPLLLALPLTLAGSMGALLITNRSLDLVSAFGAVLGVALVVTHATQLLTYARRRREAGASLRVSLIEAGRVRLRSALITTCALSAALGPLAVTPTSGSDQASALGAAALGGVLTCLVSTLVVIPTLYAMFDQARDRGREWLGRHL